MFKALLLHTMVCFPLATGLLLAVMLWIGGAL